MLHYELTKKTIMKRSNFSRTNKHWLTSTHKATNSAHMQSSNSLVSRMFQFVDEEHRSSFCPPLHRQAQTNVSTAEKIYYFLKTLLLASKSNTMMMLCL